MSTPQVVSARERRSLLTALPDLVRCAQSAQPDVDTARHFMDLLAARGAGLFSGCLLFLSRDGRPFVLVRESTPCAGTRHSWALWPFNRLFIAHRACVITNASDGSRALAMPFACSANERYVVVGMLPDEKAVRSDGVFMATMESIVVGSPTAISQSRIGGLDSIELESRDALPSIAWYGNEGPLYSCARKICDERAWPLHVAGNFERILKLVEHKAADIVVFDDCAVRGSLAKLRAVHHVARECEVLILYIGGSECSAELRALADECIPASATSAVMLSALKRLLTVLPARRVRALTARASREEARLRSFAHYGHLAQAIGDAAASLGADFAAVSLVDSSGDLYRAEYSPRAEPLVSSVPSTFLSGYAVVRARAGEAFLEDAFDDERTRERLMELGPLSGASLPIMDSGRVAGTLFVLFTRTQMTEAHAAALASLCDVSGRAFKEVGKRMLAARRLEAPLSWRQVELDEARVYAYCGKDSTASVIALRTETGQALCALVDAFNARASGIACEHAIRKLYSSLKTQPAEEALDAMVSSFEYEAGGIAGAIVEPSGAFHYASLGCPGAIQIPASGPVATLAENRNCDRGAMTVRPDAVALLCGPGFSHNVDTAQLVKAVRYHLERGSRNPSITIPDVGADPASLAFLSITTHWADFEPRLPSESI